MKQFHKQPNHKKMTQMEYAYRSAGNLDDKTKILIKKVGESCNVCQQNGRSRSKPSVAIP